MFVLVATVFAVIIYQINSLALYCAEILLSLLSSREFYLLLRFTLNAEFAVDLNKAVGVKVQVV